VNDFETWGVWYDEIHSHKIAENDDYEFYKSLVEENGEPALEIAVGTGRLYLDYLDEGLDVHGVDISQGMIDRLHEKSSPRNLNPTVFHGDASEIDLPTDYSTIYLPFTAITHFRTLEHQRKLFKNVYNHLDEDGVFGLDLFVTDFERVANKYGKVDVKEFEKDGVTYRFETWESLANKLEQEIVLHNRIINVDDKTIEWETSFELSLLPKQQIELLLELTGFSDWEFFDAFTRQPANADTERMTCVAYR